ncbi:MAG: murein transglycosylase [Phycisphaeraceae bacterium]|nr:murein transglycosylase [Phycisphaeraceae bacterium]
MRVADMIMIKLIKNIVCLVLTVMMLSACAKDRVQQVEVPTPQKPQYARQLGEGEQALVKLEMDQWPDLSPLLNQSNRIALDKAYKRSLAWYAAPSARTHFPVQGITHDQAQASVFAMLSMISPLDINTIKQQFDLYQSVGWDNRGTVLFTGYYSPIFNASNTRTEQFKYPLYRRPKDLVSDPISGKVMGRKLADGSFQPYYTRQQIDANNILSGNELVWLADPFDVYLIHIQGSAKLQMTDGSILYVGYAGTNGHPYHSVAKQLVADGLLDENSVNLPAIENYFSKNPQDLAPRLAQNPRYVFFQPYEPDSWPSGSMGFQVTPMVTLATDKSIFPRGAVTLIHVPMTGIDGKLRSQLRLMADQDTGGAIRAPGRSDIYYGVGQVARMQAGYQLAEGQLYYFFLKPQYVSQWMARMGMPLQ